MKRIILSLILLFCANYTYGESYYGYAGSCNDGIYLFDFKGLKVTEYMQNRIVGSEPIYSIKSRSLKKKSQNKYVIWNKTADPAIIAITSEPTIIYGKSINSGYTFYFKLCEKKMASSLIKKAKAYVSSIHKN